MKMHWYPQACRFLRLHHHIHSPYEKSIIERTVQSIKDRTEYFNDTFFLVRKSKCKLQHIQKWCDLFLVIIVTIICYLNFTEHSMNHTMLIPGYIVAKKIVTVTSYLAGSFIKPVDVALVR